jgi:hypothetical protein
MLLHLPVVVDLHATAGVDWTYCAELWRQFSTLKGTGVHGRVPRAQWKSNNYWATRPRAGDGTGRFTLYDHVLGGGRLLLTRLGGRAG